MSARIRVTLVDSEDRRVEVVADYSPATESYFDRSFGNYLPGDPEDVEVVSARALDEGADVAEVEARTDEIEEAVREAADDAADDGPDVDDERDRERDERRELAAEEARRFWGED